jgi:5'-3' exonuclease
LAKGQGLEKLIAYCVARVHLLLSNKVTPIIIFDGGKLKMKKGVEKERMNNREKAKIEANEYLAKGDEHMAMRKFSESIDITP